MSENAKLFLLGLIILYDAIYIIRNEWNKMNRQKRIREKKRNVYRK